MVIIEVSKEDKEKVFEILIGNGLFRGLGENKFDIVENADDVLEKIEKKGIKFKIIKQVT